MWKYHSVGERNFYYLVRMLNHYGIAWLDRSHYKWTSQEKKKAIDLINRESRNAIALDLVMSYPIGFKSIEKMVIIWLINHLEDWGERLSQKLSKEEENKNFKKEILYLRAENVYLKALRKLTIKKAKVIEQLRYQFSLSALLKAAKISHLTFYYQHSHEKDFQN